MTEPKLNPLSLTPADAANLMSKISGTTVTEEDVQLAIDAGAPTDTSGNINLVHLGAWLLRDNSSKK